MKESEEITKALLNFRNERDWEQFHNPKDLALAISIESAELLELFLWKNADEANVERIKRGASRHFIIFISFGGKIWF